MPTCAPPRRLGDLLIEKGFLTLEALERALAEQKTASHKGKLLGEVLVDQE
jgi:type IV pilus assembly protein PilB